MKFSVQEILDEIYGDKEEAISKLIEYDLLEIVNKKLFFLKNQVNQNKKTNLNVFAASFLQSINGIVLNIKNDDDRNDLKYILSDVGTYLIDIFIKEKTLSVNELNELKDSLKSVSEIEGYDYRDLEKYIQLGRTIKNQPKDINRSRIESHKDVYYDWMLDDYRLNEIAGNLKSEKSISSVINFKKIFSNKPEKVLFEKNNKEFIFILFDVLYEKGAIKPRGNKGHFVPLKQFAVDFENKFLFKKEMKTIKQAIKKNEVKHSKFRVKAEKWII